MIQHILKDIVESLPVEIISAKFHNTLADLIVQKIKQISVQSGITQIVLSGGCFQNKRLTEEIRRKMASEKLTLYIPAQIPCNDGGIAAGQLAIASAQKLVL
jgi:hydrogenase maturation protein HypF